MYPPPISSRRTIGDSVPIEAGRYAAGVLGVVGVEQFASFEGPDLEGFTDASLAAPTEAAPSERELELAPEE